MKDAIIGFVVNQLITNLPPDAVKRAIDAMLDRIEDAVADSETKTDDRILLPLIDMLRRSLDIPDDIGGDAD